MQKYVCNVCGYEYDPAAADPVKCLFVPKHEGLSPCVALGKTVAEALKAKC